MASDTETNKHSQNPCNFKFHEFIDDVGEVRISCHIIQMEDCLYLWIGDAKQSVMNDLAFALRSNYESIPIGTKIMGAVADETSTNIAKRLTKKLGKAVYVSFNLQADKMLLLKVEQRIQQEFKANEKLAII
ncbi:PREDICTED: proteasome assembly chaperone 4-like [Polistes canadensis]|uniref:proteasome assembly chaperone 4-like n=1 Tax=Polistes canadensis TaxID=91411 RepID=UPI0007190360|nr:PREDICTED: proteasome assembly chaperone 4-like [Polistes canadensis]